MLIQRDLNKARLIGLLLAITMVLLGLQYFGPKKILVIGRDAGLRAEALDDRGNGGESIASISDTQDTYVLDCEIVASSYTWPYCELSFILTNDQTGKGIDLSRYTHLEAHVRYSEPQEFGIRVQLVNFNPAYSSPTETTTQKYNAIELYHTHEVHPQRIVLNLMQVPTWWLNQEKIPPEYWGPEFSDVRGIQISTGERAVPGTYRIEVGTLAFHGKYITDNQLLLILVGLWSALGGFYFFENLRVTRRQLRAHQQRQRQLEVLNRLLSHQQQRLEHQLVRDPLTGLLNREGLVPVFQEASDNPERVMSLMFIDIDYFKQVNDTYGHAVGDEVLQHFGRVLTNSTRACDYLARWGGEEFVIICPDTTLDRAMSHAEKLRKNLETYEWPKGLHVTASFGVAQKFSQESLTEFIERADKALYAAKANGRNCVKAARVEHITHDKVN